MELTPPEASEPERSGDGVSEASAKPPSPAPHVPFAKTTPFGHLSPPPMQRFVRIAIPLLILAAGFGAWKWLGQPLEPPRPQMRTPQSSRPRCWNCSAPASRSPCEARAPSAPHHITTLTPLVAGRIIPSTRDLKTARSSSDEALVELDPADYQAALTGARARLARAEAALAQEEARAKQAKLNWEDIGYDEEPSDLVLRVPQLKEARANVDAALADLDQATRNLERTKIRAPFDGRVQARIVGLGQSVGAGTPLGEVFATDYAEVRLPLTPRQLAFIKLPDQRRRPAR